MTPGSAPRRAMQGQRYAPAYSLGSSHTTSRKMARGASAARRATSSRDRSAAAADTASRSCAS
eukprot:14357913-Alexandrium_andersonii.AAC.1